jgi:hypothetical protein
MWIRCLTATARLVTAQRPLLGSGQETTTEEWCFLRGPISNSWTSTKKRCFLCSQCRDVISRTSLQFSYLSGVSDLVERSELIGEWLSEFEDCCGFSPCEPLLLEAGSWGTGIVREPRVRGTSAVEAVTRKRMVKTQQAGKSLVCALLNCRMCELATALQLLVVTSCVNECAINPITDLNPVYSHTL